MKCVYMQSTNTKIPLSNIFCIGRNYVAHINELGNEREETPLVFLKPTSALNVDENVIKLPHFSHDIQYETELVLLIGEGGKLIPLAQAIDHVAGYAVGLDLTARDIQSKAKERGLPWTLAKGFDYAACVSHFIEANKIDNINDCYFEMKQNHIIRQHGDPKLMIFNIPYIISYLSTVFTLNKGDIIFTGTPEGVNQLHEGDHIEIDFDGRINASYAVIK